MSVLLSRLKHNRAEAGRTRLELEPFRDSRVPRVEMLFRLQRVAAVVVLLLAIAGCGRDEHALSVPEMKAALGTAGIDRVHVYSEKGRPDYIQVPVDGVLLVRFDSVGAAAQVNRSARPAYVAGGHGLERACNVLIYTLRKAQPAAVAARRIVRTLRQRCA